LRQSAGKFLLAFGNRLRHAPQHPLTLERGKPAGGSECFDRGFNGCISVFAASLKNVGDHIAVVRRFDFDYVAFFNPFSIEEKTLSADGSHCHLGHGASSTSAEKMN
jgi:hypothetical protein